MYHRLFAATVFCLLAWAAPAASAQAICPKAFTAKHHSSEGTGDLACDGPMFRLVMNKDTTMIHDAKSGKTTIVLDATREYAEYVPTKEEREEQDAMEFEPCSEQKKLSKETKGVTCRKTGTASVAGRSTERYETRGPDMEPIVEFFDPELKAVIKEQKGGRTQYELSDVRIGSVSPSLFRVPAGYKRLTMDQYIERSVKAAQQQEKAGKKK